MLQYWSLTLHLLDKILFSPILFIYDDDTSFQRILNKLMIGKDQGHVEMLLGFNSIHSLWVKPLVNISKYDLGVSKTFSNRFMRSEITCVKVILKTEDGPMAFRV